MRSQYKLQIETPDDTECRITSWKTVSEYTEDIDILRKKAKEYEYNLGYGAHGYRIIKRTIDEEHFTVAEQIVKLFNYYFDQYLIERNIELEQEAKLQLEKAYVALDKADKDGKEHPRIRKRIERYRNTAYAASKDRADHLRNRAIEVGKIKSNIRYV